MTTSLKEKAKAEPEKGEDLDPLFGFMNPDVESEGGPTANPLVTSGVLEKKTEKGLDTSTEVAEDTSSNLFGGSFGLDDEVDPLKEDRDFVQVGLKDTADRLKLLEGFLLLKEPGVGLGLLKIDVQAMYLRISTSRHSLDEAKTLTDMAPLKAALVELKKDLGLLRGTVTKHPNAYPKTWEDFNALNHAAFKIRLAAFRGDGDMSMSSSFRGGEGQLFFSKAHKDKALKRWMSAQLGQMGQSVGLLREARKCIDSNDALSKLLDIVNVYEEVRDWILRDFDPDSIPLAKAIQAPTVIECKAQAIAALQGNDDKISVELREKLERNSANLHWSPTAKKILVIDMM